MKKRSLPRTASTHVSSHSAPIQKPARGTRINVNRLYINGRWTSALESRTLLNPATGAHLAEVAEASATDTEAAIGAARKAFDNGPWREANARQRAEILFGMAAIVRRHRDELANLETLNTGKPIIESEADMDDTAACFEYYGGLATKITGETNPVPDNAMNFTLREPVGVCGLIIPWNYPLMMLAWKVAPAIAAGCTMVLKPAEQTPLTALAFAGFLTQELPALPAGVLNIVTGDGETCGTTLVRSPHVDKIAFTGGTDTGQAILRSIGESHMKKVSLELGGKSPNIFFADADLEASIDGALFGVMINQGEVCSAGSRILVQEKWAKPFTDRLIRQAAAIRLGDPLRRDTKMGPLITRDHRERVLGFIERAGAEGAKLATGGSAPRNAALRNGWYLSPTVFTRVEPGMEIFQEEVFGPVVSVTTFKDEDEAIALANQTRFGLAGAIWTRDIFRAFRMIRALRAGIVWVNTMQPCFVEAPWGGYKSSGIGRELGHHGIDEFLESKQVHINLSEAPIGWYTGSEKR